MEDHTFNLGKYLKEKWAYERQTNYICPYEGEGDEPRLYQYRGNTSFGVPIGEGRYWHRPIRYE